MTTFYQTMRLFSLTLYLVGYAFAMTIHAEESTTHNVPKDPKVVIGQLQNGLTYYIRPNSTPEKRLDLRLVVKAGSVLETEEQRGLAHFVEHMNFKGSKNFSQTEMIDYLESVGSQFGADLNAYTSFDHTVYMLHLPIDENEILEKGFLILSDWAARATMATEAIESERPIVHDELRRRRGAQQRLMDDWLKTIFEGSKYANRLPIGLEDVILNCSPELVRDFYKKWYRPEFMAVVAVGDFKETKEIEDLIHRHFDSIPASSPRPPILPDFGILSGNNPKFLVQPDPENTQTAILIANKRPTFALNSTSAYRKLLVEDLFYSMLLMRLKELTEKTDSLILDLGAGPSQFIKPIYLDYLKVMVTENQVMPALEELLIELRRIEKFGFTQEELARAKANKLSELEHNYFNWSKVKSKHLIKDYVDHFLFQKDIPEDEWTYKFAQEIFPSIKLEDFQEHTTRFMPNKGQVVSIELPQKEGLIPPQEGEIQALLAKIQQQEITPYVETQFTTKLFDKVVTPGKLETKEFHASLGLTELVYTNGVKVYLKPTQFHKDQILLQGVALGGSSTYSLQDLPSLQLALPISHKSGWGGLTPSQLNKLLAGKEVSVSQSIEPYVRKILMHSRTSDLETGLQVLNMHLMDPNYNEEAFEKTLSIAHESIRNRLKNPMTVFQDRVRSINTQSYPFFEPLDESKLARVNHKRSHEIYKECFSNPSDFTFFVVGDFEIDQMEKLLSTYLGSIPCKTAAGIKEYTALSFSFPMKPVTEYVKHGIDRKSMTQVSWPIESLETEEEMIKLQLACHLLEKKLLQLLRIEMGGTYSTSVSFRLLQPSHINGTIQIVFSSDPGNVEPLVKGIWDTVKSLQEEGAKAEDLKAIQTIEIRHLERAYAENQFWLEELSYYASKKWPFENILTLLQKTDQVTSEQLQQTYRKYFNADRYTQVSLIPAEASSQ
ncbi:MAG: zinc protease [Chlamydiales bacterium]|jgi:zinc protease|nr:zinc protease [Chlamydiales bacterium]